MTVKSDLKKAIASAESAKGDYATFAEATEDQMAKAMFTQMAQDMDRHIEQLNSRLHYLNQSNPMNAGQQQ
jgi:rubrerythrin